MKLIHLIQKVTALILCTTALICAAEQPPNIIVILSDDQGYADVSYNPLHKEEISTPNIDKLAKDGVTLSRGYTTGCVCSPTRAGLMTGRYQQRFGIYTAGEGGTGGTLGAKFISNYLKEKGYVSGAFGKWHLGLEMEYNPINRGFDEFYGFMGRGSHDYFSLDRGTIFRGKETIKDEGYITTRLTEETVAFIKKHKDKPFFAYVAYNAPHGPKQAPEEDIKRFKSDIEDRNILAAMIYHLDLGVGEIVKATQETGVFENTLFIYLSDNGGAASMKADNAPFRGSKQYFYEGGVRVPFFVTWPAKLKAGTTCDVPILSIDILPTILSAAGIGIPSDAKLDGKNMFPVLNGEAEKLHDHVCWNKGNGHWAIMRDQWKLVGNKEEIELFNLSDDISEENDLSQTNMEKVEELTKLYNTWLAEMPEPNSTTGFKKYDPALHKEMLKNLKNKKKSQKTGNSG